MKAIRNALRVLLTPGCWIQVKRYSPEWDKRLLELLETERFHSINKWTVKLGDQEIWIENHPYASFAPYFYSLYSGIDAEVRPRRSTILYAMDKLEAAKFGAAESRQKSGTGESN